MKTAQDLFILLKLKFRDLDSCSNTEEAKKQILDVLEEHLKTESQFEQLKADRTKQWANKSGNPKGWDNYRPSTFMEVIRAKWDRALQAQSMIQELNIRPDTQEKIKKLEFDAVDSIKDAVNYSQELLRQITETPQLLLENKLR
jgi:methyltransferase-like protein